MSANEEVEVEIEDEELLEMKKELERLNNITNALWQEGINSKWQSMTHTIVGVKKYELKKKREVILGPMSSLFQKKTNTVNPILPTNIRYTNKTTVTNNKTYRNRGSVNFSTGKFMSL